MSSSLRIFTFWFSLSVTLAVSQIAGATPFVGSGSDGDFVSTATVLFDTDTGTVFSSGSSKVLGEVTNDATIFDFSSIRISAGHTITATGSRPLVLLSI